VAGVVEEFIVVCATTCCVVVAVEVMAAHEGRRTFGRFDEVGADIPRGRRWRWLAIRDDRHLHDGCR
jgi:hypothetical protein